jgi:hypothetical protein
LFYVNQPKKIKQIDRAIAIAIAIVELKQRILPARREFDPE